MLKNILRKSLIPLFISIFIILYFYYLSAIFLHPNNLEDKVSYVMILGFFTVSIGFFLFTTLKLNVENRNFIQFKCIPEELIKFILIILMFFVFLIPPVEFSSAVINWEEIDSINIIRAIIFIIGIAFLPGACLFKITFPKSKLHETFNVESFFLKITLYPILSFAFIGVCVFILDVIGLLSDFFPSILFFIISGLFISNLIVQIKRKDYRWFSFENLSISKNTFVILIVAIGVSIFALGILLSVGYLMKGDAWIGLSSANFIGKHNISPINFGKEGKYPIFWGYIIFGLANLTGLPYINTNALLAPFCYLSITSMYLFLKSILDKYNETYAVLTTILISVFGGIFFFYPIEINNWYAISHYTFRSQFNLDYKNFSYLLLYTSLALFFIKSDDNFDITKKVFYRSEDFKLLFLSSFLLFLSFLIYMIPLITGIYIIFLFCLFSEKNFRWRKFQFFKLQIILISIFFFIFDVSLEFFLSRLYYMKYSKFFFVHEIINKYIIFYLSFFGLILFVSFVQYVSTKSLLNKNKKYLILNLNPKYVFITFLSIFTVYVILNIYNILYLTYTYKYVFINKNYWYYVGFYIFLNIGIIGIISMYLSYFCFKKYRNLFYFLTSWIIVSFLYSLNQFLVNIFLPDEIVFKNYRGALDFFNKNWIFAIPALCILTSIGSIEFFHFLKFSEKKSDSHLNFRNRDLYSVLKLTFVSFLILTSYSNTFITGSIKGNSDERLADEKANVLGWIIENLDYDSRFLIENDYSIYTILSNSLDRECCYFIYRGLSKSQLFDFDLPYLEQIHEIKRRNVQYAIFYDTNHIGASKEIVDFIDNYLSVEIYTKEIYRYEDLAVYYAPNIAGVGYYEPKNYSGTFSFDYDEIGTEPLDWDVSTAYSNCYVKVVENYLGHAKIMQIFDNSKTSNVLATQSFNSSKTNGTIEFWIFHSNPYEYVRIFLEGENINGPSLNLGENEWKYHNGDRYHILPRVSQPSRFKWHHIRIDFECGNGGYLGLEAKKCRFIIDGINSGDLDFQDNPKSIEKFKIETLKLEQEYNQLYLDAIGYSWDLRYDIGDNLI